MNSQESIALFKEGREAWNSWVKKILDERASLEADGTWVEDGNESSCNDATRAWRAAAAADFSKYRFQHLADFSGLNFPGNAEFTEATFTGNAGFSGATFSGNAGFSGATFSSDAEFAGATFSGGAEFTEATFSGGAKFTEATFSRNADFTGATFSYDAWFAKTTFRGLAFFIRASFEGRAYFNDATFKHAARFEKASFAKTAWFDRVTFTISPFFNEATFADYTTFDRAIFLGGAWFQQAVFEGRATFNDTSFKGATSFSAIDAKSAFSLARATFLAVPDFIQAHFGEAPRLDNCHIRPQRQPLTLTSAKKSIKDRFTGDPNRAARWRALKRLAIQGHDHAREQAFFKGELKARRCTEDKLRHGAFWSGLFYQGFSDFGRSIWLPFIWWCFSVLVFTGLYLAQHPTIGQKGLPLKCVAGPGVPWLAALTLSIQKGLLVSGVVPQSKLNQIYACLYGIHTADATQTSQLPGSFSPVIPDCVTVLGFVQYPLSAVLIFLFLLAIRNHFRIK